jgi:hypothetical protein
MSKPAMAVTKIFNTAIRVFMRKYPLWLYLP